MGCPIRKSTDQHFYAAPRSLSQLGTSFIATVCLGIHRTPLSTLTLNGLHVHCKTPNKLMSSISSSLLNCCKTTRLAASSLTYSFCFLTIHSMSKNIQEDPGQSNPKTAQAKYPAKTLITTYRDIIYKKMRGAT